MLETDNLGKRFGGLVAVDKVSMKVENNCIFGLIGPNGAGKTTLLNCIAGSLTPSNGKVFLEGKDLTGKSADVMCRMGVGRTFQIPTTFPKMSVLENVLVGAVFGDSRKNETSAEFRAREALETVNFQIDLNTPAEQLNTVQLKHLDLARALACNPKLLLLDELASGLNPTEIISIMDLIMRIRDKKITIIIVEHIMQVIQGICDFVMAVDYGKPIAVGTSNEVLKNPEVIKAYLGE